MAQSIEQRGHHVTCELFGTSLKLAAYNYTSSLALWTTLEYELVDANKGIQQVRVEPATRSAVATWDNITFIWVWFNTTWEVTLDCHNIPFSLTMHTLTHTHRLAADISTVRLASMAAVDINLPAWINGAEPCVFYTLHHLCSCSYWKSSFFYVLFLVCLCTWDTGRNALCGI